MTDTESKLLDVIAKLRAENSDLRTQIAGLLDLIQHLSISINDHHG